MSATTRPARAVPPTAAWRSRWTTRQWLRAGVSVALIVLMSLSVLGAVVLNRMTTISNRLVDRSSPALIAAVRLEAALLNQETGIRGYGLSGNPVFLQPYRQGLAQQQQADQELRALADDRTTREDLLVVQARSRTWQERFATVVAAAPADRAVAVARERSEEGKVAFDDVRQALTVQQRHLQAARDESRADLIAMRSLRNGLFSVIALLILALAVVVSAALRRAVTTPLERLAADARSVAEGDFSHPIMSSGPADMRALGQDVEAMRRRMADDLARSEEVRAVLDEQTADLRRSNTELEQFAYVASHDLQEPLRKVTAFCQLLERNYGDRLDDRARKYIEFAVDGALRMQTLINDLLDFSRVGRLHNQHVPVDLQALFAETAKTLSLAITEADADVTCDPLPTVTGDRTQLGMLLHNLLGNAIKFRSPDRPCRVHLAVQRDDRVWRFTFGDNGIGIAPEFADRIFVIFQRLHTRQDYPGNGIGLALCKKIVEFHGGSISLDSGAEEPGTRFVFTLPADSPEPVAPTEEGTGPSYDGQKNS
ncbi:sensor histidine kinase [Streptosporangium saharense]|uniref:sensor histidine kinase n=1 Tax=Streptosporangium saharense TaxID=1706840 RepID=UPI00331807D0